MLTTVLEFTIILISATGIRTEDEPKCLESWTLYDEENTCIKFFTFAKTWPDARAFCQDMEADLVQIWNDEKNTIVKEIRKDPNAKYWMGLDDRDRDGTYEYVNGTNLYTTELGLGDFSKDDAVWPVYDQQCVVLLWGEYGWRSQACDIEDPFICEKSLMPMTMPKYPAPCEDCVCDRSKWKYYGGEDTYVKVFKGAKDFLEAALTCESYNAGMLSLYNREKEAFIKNSLVDEWTPKGVFYWLGLLIRDERYTWDTSRALLKEDEFQNWFSDTLGITCAAVIWDYDAKWRALDCGTRRFYICESQDPCSLFPVISINNKVLPRNENATIINEQKGIIRCSFQGRPENVSSITLNCGFDLTKGTSEVHKTETIIDFGVQIHGKTCVCEVTFIDMIKKETENILYFRTQPRLVNGSDNNNTIAMKKGVDIVVLFDIYANPIPLTYKTMTKRGGNLDPDAYNVTMTPIEDKDLHYSIHIKMGVFTAKMAGMYTLPIDNGIGKCLYLSFLLKVHEKKSDIKAGGSNWMVVLGILASLLILGLVLFLLVRWIHQTPVVDEIEVEEEAEFQLSPEAVNEPVDILTSPEELIIAEEGQENEVDLEIKDEEINSDSKEDKQKPMSTSV